MNTDLLQQIKDAVAKEHEHYSAIINEIAERYAAACVDNYTIYMKTSDKDSNANVCPHTNQMCFMPNCALGHCGNPPAEQKDTDLTLLEPINHRKNLFIERYSRNREKMNMTDSLNELYELFVGPQERQIKILNSENERLKKQVEWLEKEYQNKAH